MYSDFAEEHPLLHGLAARIHTQAKLMTGELIVTSQCGDHLRAILEMRWGVRLSDNGSKAPGRPQHAERNVADVLENPSTMNVSSRPPDAAVSPTDQARVETPDVDEDDSNIEYAPPDPEPWSDVPLLPPSEDRNESLGTKGSQERGGGDSLSVVSVRVGARATVDAGGSTTTKSLTCNGVAISACADLERTKDLPPPVVVAKQKPRVRRVKRTKQTEAPEISAPEMAFTDMREQGTKVTVAPTAGGTDEEGSTEVIVSLEESLGGGDELFGEYAGRAVDGRDKGIASPSIFAFQVPNDSMMVWDRTVSATACAKVGSSCETVADLRRLLPRQRDYRGG